MTTTRMEARATAAARAGDEAAPCYGALHDLERTVKTHLFGIACNNSGSNFLREAIATCRETWNLSGEGHYAAGFRGPVTWRTQIAGLPPPGLVWAANPLWTVWLSEPSRYDWAATRKAWYFQARARHPRASVFYTNTPSHLIVVGELARSFRNAKFLFMVRNPYAVCEGIFRAYTQRRRREFRGTRADLAEAAATHVAVCLVRQRHNVEAYGERGAFFTYEEMCAAPERVAGRIRALVPELDDLNLRRRLRVKRRYDEMLTDMNARQIARLEPWQFAVFNRVFEVHRELLEHFGYGLMDAPGACSGAAAE